jgi:hypothetical protein
MSWSGVGTAISSAASSSSGWMSTFSSFAQGFGAVANVYGAVNQAKVNNTVAENNAKLAEYQARQALRQGAAQEQALRLRTAQMKGTQRATMAARGLSLTEGSPLNILTTTDYMGERDALTARDNALRTAWGYRQEAANYKAGKVDVGMAGLTAAFTSAPTVASSWLKFNDMYNSKA